MATRSKAKRSKTPLDFWRDAVRGGKFGRIAVEVLTGTGVSSFPLKGEQADELEQWYMGRHDSEWLVCSTKGANKGIPLHFVAQNGALDKLTLAPAPTASADPTAGGGKRKATTHAAANPPAVKAAKGTAATAASGGGAASGLCAAATLPATTNGLGGVAKKCTLSASMYSWEDDFASGNLQYTEYLATEKYDGWRAIWMGSTLYSRQGNSHGFRGITQFFKSRLPAGIILDGELRHKDVKGDRGLVSGLLGKVDGKTPESECDLCYFIFDAPSLDGNYRERLDEAKRICGGETANVKFCDTKMCPDRASLRAYRDSIIKAGGEGVVLHRIEGPYSWQESSKRTSATIKYKPYYEQEVKVVGTADTGYAECVFPNSKTRFSVNTLAHRDKAKRGRIIRIKFLGLKASGVPEHPAYLDHSPDRQDWGWLCSQFPEPEDVNLGALQRQDSGGMLAPMLP